MDTIEDFIDFEFRHNLVFLNGNSYKSALKAAQGDTKFLVDNKDKLYNYQSISWIVIRGAWLYDFLSELFHQSLLIPEKELSAVAYAAYDKGLRPHHPWII